MDPLIQTLVRFQELNLEASRLDARLSQIPTELKAIDDEQHAVSASVALAKDRLHESGKRRRDLEHQLQDLEGKISKYNDQSREVKTNEQYRAILHEIQTVKTHIGDVEEKILLEMEASDVLEKQIRDEEKAFGSHKAEFEARRATLSAERGGLTAERDRLTAESEKAQKEIPPDALNIYNTLAKIRSGVAMARALDERCMACNVRIRPQVFSDVRKNNQIIQCESCKRILYYVEEAPQPDAEGAQKEAGGAESGGAGPAPEAPPA